MRFARSTRREDSMREQYEIGIQLLDHEQADRELEWLPRPRSGVRVWRCGMATLGRGLRIAGAYDPDDALPAWSADVQS